MIREKATILCVIALIFLGYSTSASAQVHEQDRVVGYSSPIPDRDVGPTYGREYDGLKPGLGREEVYFAFSPCLKTGWIKRQSMSAETWRAEVEKMATQCGIAPLGEDETNVIVDYLASEYGGR
jgi:hypothetical protein